MKRWLLYALALGGIIALELSPFSATDIGKLRPVEVVSLTIDEGQMLLQTDTGDEGRGDTVGQALNALKNTTPGEIFLETADHLLIGPGCEGQVTEMALYLRPSCSICLREGQPELEKAAEFLSAHRPQVTLQDWRSGIRQIPTLKTQKERMELVQ